MILALTAANHSTLSKSVVFARVSIEITEL